MTMSHSDFVVKVHRYSAGRFLISIDGKRYDYGVSPFVAEKFKRALKHNRGRAVAMVRGHEVDVYPGLVMA